MVMSVKAQINGLKLIMNKAYLTFMNVTLYKEVISKHVSHSASQYVLVALTRAGKVHTNKYLWELIITRRKFIRRQRLNAEKMKENDLQAKLVQMQKSTDTQLDDKVNEKVDQTVPRAVREILNEDLNTKAFKKSKRRKSLNTSSTDGMIIQQSAASENIISNVASMQSTAPIIPPLPQPLSAPNTFVDASGNQFFMVPAGQLPQLLQRAPTNEQANILLVHVVVVSLEAG